MSQIVNEEFGVKLKTVRKRGISMVIFAPEGAKVVKVRLLRNGRVITRVVRKVSKDGVMTVVLPSTKQGRRHLKRGVYKVQVTPGASSSRSAGAADDRRQPPQSSVTYPVAHEVRARHLSRNVTTKSSRACSRSSPCRPATTDRRSASLVMSTRTRKSRSSMVMPERRRNFWNSRWDLNEWRFVERYSATTFARVMLMWRSRASPWIHRAEIRNWRVWSRSAG